MMRRFLVLMGLMLASSAHAQPGAIGGGASAVGPNDTVQLSDGAGGLKAGPLIGDIALAPTTVGTEDDWNAWLAQRAPHSIPSHFRWSYFDADNGDDANSCGPSDPCQTIARANVICALSFSACVFDAADTWDGAAYGSGLLIVPRCSLDVNDAGMLCQYVLSRERIGLTGQWSETPNMATFSTAAAGDAPNGSVVRVGLASELDQYGTVVVEGIRVISDTSGIDGFSQKGSAHLRVIRSECTSTAAGVSDQCFTSHDTGALIVSNSSAEKTNGNSAIKPVGTSRLIVVGNNRIRMNDAVGSLPVVTLDTDAAILLAGLTIECNKTTTNGEAVGIDILQEAYTQMVLTTVRNVITGCDDIDGNGSRAVFLKGGANTVYSWISRQDTITNSDRAIRAVTALSGASAVTIDVRGMLIDEITNLVMSLGDGFATSPFIVSTFDAFIYDNEDAADPFKIDTNAQTEFSAFDAAATSWTFTNAIDSGGATVDGSQFVAGTALCDVEKECDAGMEAAYTVTLPVCLESWDIGRRICSFNLEGRNIGAR